VSGIEVDPAWVDGYATKVRDSADDLRKAADSLNGAALGADAFGELGRTARTADAYLRAAGTLREQLGRAVDSLSSAAEGLNSVTRRYSTDDEDSAGQINRAKQD
jgi:hypothetical protein